MAAVVFTVTDTPGPSIPLAGGGQTGARLVTKTLTADGGDATAGGDGFGGSSNSARLANWAAALGLGSITWLHATAVAAGFVHTFDYTTGKLQTWQSAGSNAALDEANGVAISHAIKVTALGAPA